MKLLSIDVGIKNLAYCLFDLNEIILWDVINLCGQEPNCDISACKKKAKFSLGTTQMKNLCQTHSKKSEYISKISLKKIKKMKLIELHQLVKEYSIPLLPTVIKKEDVLKTILEFMENKILQPVLKTSANDMDAVKMGIALRNAFDKELVNHLNTITHIAIENQISPIANRMKTLQGMITQYFIMRDKTNITFVSAANKLKIGGKPPHPLGVPPPHPLGGKPLANDVVDMVEIIQEDDVNLIPEIKGGLNPQGGCGGGTPKGSGGGTPKSYASRKKDGIKFTLELLNEKHIQWLPHFNQHKKKDDLADAFLQGIWFIKKNCYIL
jgi:hypothetical protein